MARREPIRYEMRMRPDFAEEHSRDQVVGFPFRNTRGGGLLSAGVVIDWVDEPDGAVTLVVEQGA